MGTKQRVCSAGWKQELPVLPSLVRMRVGRGSLFCWMEAGTSCFTIFGKDASG